MRILVIGSGAREHALAWKFAKESSHHEIFVWPGNVVTRQTFRALDCPSSADFDELAQAARRFAVDIVVVGPEQPLAEGLADKFSQLGLTVFGPSAAAAQLEASKAFAKEVMQSAGVPTASYAKVHNEAEVERLALQYLAQNKPFVIKASGLASGKGVFVCHTKEDLSQALYHLFQTDMQSAATDIIVEDFLVGRECSHFVMVRNNVPVSLGFAVDFKRLLDKDEGPNTGGMGCYTPVPWLPKDADTQVHTKILQPLLQELAGRGISYTGFLYTGLMWTAEGPKVVEFNVRLGDPEAQVLCVRDTRPWLPWILGREKSLPTHQSAYVAVGVVMASEGYPFAAPSHPPAEIPVKLLHRQNSDVFTAAVKEAKNKELFLSGQGRVCTVVALGHGFEEAKRKAYEHVHMIHTHWEQAQFRRDIAERVARESVK